MSHSRSGDKNPEASEKFSDHNEENLAGGRQEAPEEDEEITEEESEKK